jgi:hypothetical protein
VITLASGIRWHRKVTLHDQRCAPRRIRGIVWRDRSQPIDVPVEHAKHWANAAAMAPPKKAGRPLADLMVLA